MTNKRNKLNISGISLIVLVITIIVIIIIAGAIILSLNNSGIIGKSTLARESNDFANIRQMVELSKANMLLTGQFNKEKIQIPNIYKDDIEITDTGEIILRHNANTKITDISNAIEKLGASYLLDGFDYVETISSREFDSEKLAEYDYRNVAKVIIEGNSEQVVTTQSDNKAELTDTSLYGIPSQNVFDSGYVTITRNLTSGYLDFTPNMSNYVKSLISISKTYKVIIEVVENTFTNAGLSFSNGYSPFSSGNATFAPNEIGVKSFISTIRSSFNITNNYGYFILTNIPTSSIIGQKIRFRYSFYELGSEPNPYVYNQFRSNSPSPENSSEISSVSNFDLISSNGDDLEDSMNFPYTLRSLPDGTKDYIEIDNVNETIKLYKNVNVKVLNGNETWTQSGFQTTDTIFGAYTTIADAALAKTPYNDGSLSGYFSHGSVKEYYAQGMTSGFVYNSNTSHWLIVPKTIAADVTTFKSWLVYQYNSGTPVTIQYKLSTPVVTNLDYKEIITYYPYTQIYTNAGVKPIIGAKVILN